MFLANMQIPTKVLPKTKVYKLINTQLAYVISYLLYLISYLCYLIDYISLMPIAYCLLIAYWLPTDCLLIACPRNRSLGGFYNSLVFDQNTRENWKWGDPPKKSKVDCKLQVKTNLLTKTWNDPMTHSFDLPWTLY